MGVTSRRGARPRDAVTPRGVGARYVPTSVLVDVRPVASVAASAFPRSTVAANPRLGRAVPSGLEAPCHDARRRPDTPHRTLLDSSHRPRNTLRWFASRFVSCGAVPWSVVRVSIRLTGLGRARTATRDDSRGAGVDPGGPGAAETGSGGGTTCQSNGTGRRPLVICHDAPIASWRRCHTPPAGSGG